jgi:hypothetical protein
MEMKQKLNRIRILSWALPCFAVLPLMAQSQIGGGTCSSASLTGAYSVTLTGRALNSAVTYTSATEAVGSVTFDGLSRVTFTLTQNTAGVTGAAQTLSGSYSLQANCLGALTVTSGDSASFTLEAYNTGKAFLITGQDAAYTFTGNGGTLPATCPVGLTAGSYPFSGSGFGLTSSTISGAFEIIGLVLFSGSNTISINANIVSGGPVKTISATGTYTLSPGCSATASVTDGSGTTYALVLEFTSASGGNFILSSASAASIYTGTGRPL